MLNKKEVVDYLRMALLLKDPVLETDEAFKFTDEQLWSIFQLVIPTHNPEYSVDSFPENEKYFAMLLAKKEIYYRLAVASAPFYPLEAEGAKLRKDYRFEHYMSLIRRVESEYNLMWGSFSSAKSTIEVGEVILQSKHFTLRNHDLVGKPEIKLRVDAIGKDSVDISWSKFNVTKGMFKEYTVYVGYEPIYDEYEETFNDEALKVTITDIHRTKYRFKDLIEDGKYYVAVECEDLNGMKGISQLECIREVPMAEIEPIEIPLIPLEPSTPIDPPIEETP